jgi:hypothetical protein
MVIFTNGPHSLPQVEYNQGISFTPETAMSIFDPILNLPLFSRIRRNHGLEHATLHVLAERHPGLKMGGFSDFMGFWLVGDLTAADVSQAAQEALDRMKAGAHNLAVHPNCGTNFATAGSLAGLAGVVGMWRVGARKRDKLERLPLVATLATLALIFAQPLGLTIQKHLTTSGVPGDLEIVQVIPSKRGRMTAYRVLTRG